MKTNNLYDETCETYEAVLTPRTWPPRCLQ